MASVQLDRLEQATGDVYLTVAELADRCRVAVWTIRDWRKKGRAPKGTKLGGQVLFALSDVIEWERARREASA